MGLGLKMKTTKHFRRCVLEQCFLHEQATRVQINHHQCNIEKIIYWISYI